MKDIATTSSSPIERRSISQISLNSFNIQLRHGVLADQRADTPPLFKKEPRDVPTDEARRTRYQGGLHDGVIGTSRS